MLLPIFDHVRAEVTDTTTFTDEKKRAEVDAWLYETCTKCLQHIIDIVDQYYKLVKPIIPKILDLLANFIRYSTLVHRFCLPPACPLRLLDIPAVWLDAFQISV